MIKDLRPSYTNVCSRFSRTVRHREGSTGDAVDISIEATYGQNGATWAIANVGVRASWPGIAVPQTFDVVP